MKRQALIKHLEKEGCILLREGKRHAIYYNPINKKQSSVGRHNEQSDLLCLKVCKQLEINPVK
jgi:mRNA interferase HicA